MVRFTAVDEGQERSAVIKVVGVGGAGQNAVNRMVEANLKGVELIAVNTDNQALSRSQAHNRLQIGEQITQGLGVGGDPDKGQRSAHESREQMSEALHGADMIVVTAGMGGGTGTGAAPVIARIAKDLGALVVGVVTRPFEFEGSRRQSFARVGIEKMREVVDTLLIIPNDKIFSVIDENTTSEEAFRRADDVLRQTIQAMSDVITTAGDINVDFADLKAIMANSGEALMGIGEAKGATRAIDAAKRAVHSELLENVVIDGARGLIVNITGPRNVTLAEVKEAMDFIHRNVSSEANVKFGQAYDESLVDTIRITAIATGFPKKKLRPTTKKAKTGFNVAAMDPMSPVPEPASHSGPDEWIKPAYLRIKSKKLQ